MSNKIFFVLLFSLITTAANAQSVVTIDPGAKVGIQAGESVVVACTGSSAAGAPECIITDNTETDKYGFQCKEFGYCAVIYKFGAFIKHTSGKDTAALAEWCEAELEKQ